MSPNIDTIGTAYRFLMIGVAKVTFGLPSMSKDGVREFDGTSLGLLD